MFFIYSSVNIFPYGWNKCKIFGWVVPKVYTTYIYKKNDQLFETFFEYDCFFSVET